jgi:ADP-ribosylation factor related protein 1
VLVKLGARDSRVLPISALEGYASTIYTCVLANGSYSLGVKEAVEWLKLRVMWNKESRPPNMR